MSRDPVCERCVVRAKPAAGFLDAAQIPVRGLYFGEFITAHDPALSLSELEVLVNSYEWMHFSVTVSCTPSSQG